jgi:hypothetical protein
VDEMTDFALEQKLQLAEKTIEQLRRENERLSTMFGASAYALELEKQLAAQALVIEKLRSSLIKARKCLEWVKHIRDTWGGKVSKSEVEETLGNIREVISFSTPDYRKELAERDAALLERVIEKLKSKQSHEAAAAAHHSGSWQEAYEHHMKRQGAVSECVDVVRDIAAKIRAGVTI